MVEPTFYIHIFFLPGFTFICRTFFFGFLLSCAGQFEGEINGVLEDWAVACFAAGSTAAAARNEIGLRETVGTP